MYMYKDSDAKRNHRNRTRIRNGFFYAATRHQKQIASLDYNRLRTRELKFL